MISSPLGVHVEDDGLTAGGFDNRPECVLIHLRHSSHFRRRRRGVQAGLHPESRAQPSVSPLYYIQLGEINCDADHGGLLCGDYSLGHRILQNRGPWSCTVHLQRHCRRYVLCGKVEERER